jgi:beta-mannosidase
MVIDSNNCEIIKDAIDFEVEPSRASVVLECDLASVVAGHEREYYLAYRISDSMFYHPISTALFVSARDFSFKKPNISVEINGQGSEYTLTLISDVYTRAVAIDFGDEDVILDDNYFDVTSVAPVRIGIHAYRPTALASLQRQLNIRSLYDIGRT